MKTCTYPKCYNPVFSRYRCIYHQTVQKRKPREVKFILYREDTPSIMENLNLPKLPKKKSQIELFLHIWNTRPHVSELSGISLEKYKGGILFLNCFLHVLNKNKYPKFKYLEENIMLGDPIEHRLIDFGTLDQRRDYNAGAEFPANFDLFYEKQVELKIKYKNE